MSLNQLKNYARKWHQRLVQGATSTAPDDDHQQQQTPQQSIAALSPPASSDAPGDRDGNVTTSATATIDMLVGVSSNTADSASSMSSSPNEATRHQSDRSRSPSPSILADHLSVSMPSLIDDPITGLDDLGELVPNAQQPQVAAVSTSRISSRPTSTSRLRRRILRLRKALETNGSGGGGSDGRSPDGATAVPSDRLIVAQRRWQWLHDRQTTLLATVRRFGRMQKQMLCRRKATNRLIYVCALNSLGQRRGEAQRSLRLVRAERGRVEVEMTQAAAAAVVEEVEELDEVEEVEEKEEVEEVEVEGGDAV